MMFILFRKKLWHFVIYIYITNMCWEDDGGTSITYVWSSHPFISSGSTVACNEYLHSRRQCPPPLHPPPGQLNPPQPPTPTPHLYHEPRRFLFLGTPLTTLQDDTWSTVRDAFLSPVLADQCMYTQGPDYVHTTLSLTQAGYLHTERLWIIVLLLPRLIA